MKRVISLILLCALTLGMVSCDMTFKEAEEAALAEFGTKVDVSDIDRSEDIHIRDKDLIYKNQNNTEIVTMYLTVYTGNSAENTDHTWEEINTYSVFDYDEMGVDRYKVAGLLQVGDENGLTEGELGYGQVAPNCTVQIRGQSSSRNAQKNYKISVKDNKGDWRGQTTIALNKHQTDGLRFRNKLCYDLIAGIDEMISLRTTFVHLYVKDTTEGGSGRFEDYGIYTQVEQLNKTALERHGLDKRGHLYKINYFEFQRYEDIIKLTSDPDYDVKAFEELLEIKGDDDHSKLIALLEAVNDYSVPIEDTLARYFDIENLSYWMAFMILVGNIDTQSRNVYIYSPLNSERWYFLPWDNDGSLKRTENTLTGRFDQQEWESGVSNYWGNTLFNRCLKSEQFREALEGAMEDIYSYLKSESFTGLANAYAELLKPYVYSGADVTYAPLTPEGYDAVVSGLSDEIDLNYSLFKSSYEKPMPFFIGAPKDSGDKLSIEWEASYSFDNENITYTLEVARDHLFTETLTRLDGITIPSAEFDKPPAGQFFVRITAKDQSGDTQTAFDYYVLENGKVYGTRSFYMLPDGTVAEDIYAED